MTLPNEYTSLRVVGDTFDGPSSSSSSVVLRPSNSGAAQRRVAGNDVANVEPPSSVNNVDSPKPAIHAFPCLLMKMLDWGD